MSSSVDPRADSDGVPAPGTVVSARYRIGDLIERRGNVLRFRGIDMTGSEDSPIPVTIVRAPADASSSQWNLALPTLPDENVSPLADTKIDVPPVWPGIRWERRVLARSPHLSLPRVMDGFTEDGFDYLIEEVPFGVPLWDAWEERPVSWKQRFEWLAQIAESLNELHAAGTLLEGLTPARIVVTPTSQAALTDVAGLLPWPVPADATTSPGLEIAPELRKRPPDGGPHTSLYSIGALLQALLLGHELTELDFNHDGEPRPLMERDADAHPALGRLLFRTLNPEPLLRFPSHSRVEDDPTGFLELLETLRLTGELLDTLGFEASAWSNTGNVRSGNEDVVCVLAGRQGLLDRNGDYALIALADGMGGMASGEVAAALTIQTVRDQFLAKCPFPPDSRSTHDRHQIRQLLEDAIREANRAVLAESERKPDRRGMGCTVEVLVAIGREAIVGHVGDSRVYHLSRGRLRQVTSDHTLVSQLVALGQLTPEEAAFHPQRSELQQAIGGRRDVYPDFHIIDVEAGDWLVVCSDGLSNELDEAAFAEVLRGSPSAEKAAKRLVNRALLHGGLDNVTVAVVHVS